MANGGDLWLARDRGSQEAMLWLGGSPKKKREKEKRRAGQTKTGSHSISFFFSKSQTCLLEHSLLASFVLILLLALLHSLLRVPLQVSHTLPLLPLPTPTNPTSDKPFLLQPSDTRKNTNGSLLRMMLVPSVSLIMPRRALATLSLLKSLPPAKLSPERVSDSAYVHV